MLCIAAHERPLPLRSRPGLVSCLPDAPFPLGWDVAVVGLASQDVLERLRAGDANRPIILCVDEVSDERLRLAAAHGALLVTSQDGRLLDATVDHQLGVAREQREHRRMIDFGAGRRQILEALASGLPLADVLERIVVLVEAQTEGVMGSIVLIETEGSRRVIRRGAAPHLPPEFTAAIEGLEIGPTAGSCGAAAYLGQRVIAADLATHPNWAPYRHIALPAGLRSCWSSPIFSPSHEVLGTFAMYRREPHEPRPEEFEWAGAAVDLAAVAIVHAQARERLLWQASLLDAAKEAVVVFGADGRVRWWNSGAERLSGWPRAEVLGRPVGSFLFTERSELEAAEAEVLERGEFEGELTQNTRDGRQLTVEASWTRLTAADGVTRSVLAIHTDVTVKKTLEAQLLRRQRLESLGTLAGGIAHDFNNILTAIIGNLEVVRDEVPEGPAREALDDVRLASRRATELANQILTFSRQGTSSREALQARPVIEEALRLLRATLPAMATIRTEYAVDLPEIVADAGQLHQVVMNLGTNAAHALGTSPGTISVEARRVLLSAAEAARRPGLQAGPHLRLVFSDTGCGMSATTLEHLYEPFFTTRPVGEGSGLGLSVVHGIVESHHGAIEVRSQVGAGTTFELYFPAASSAAASTAAEPPRPSVTSGPPGRVLYVDDEPMLVRTMLRFLGGLGYQVTACTDPKDALARFTANPRGFDVVVTDLAMPQLSGAALATQLRELRPDLPLVIISGNFGESEHQLLRGLSGAELVSKPAMRELGQALERLLRR